MLLNIFSYSLLFWTVLVGRCVSAVFEISGVDPGLKGDFELKVDQGFVRRATADGAGTVTPAEVVVWGGKGGRVVQELVEFQASLGQTGNCTNYTKVLDVFQSQSTDASQTVEIHLQGQNGYLERVVTSFGGRGGLEDVFGKIDRKLHGLAPFLCESEHLKNVKRGDSPKTELRMCQIKKDSPGVSQGLQIYASKTPARDTTIGDWILANLNPKPETYDNSLVSGVGESSTGDRVAFAFYQYKGTAPTPSKDVADVSIFSDDSDPVTESRLELPSIHALRSIQLFPLNQQVDSQFLMIATGVPTDTTSKHLEEIQACTLQKQSSKYTFKSCISLVPQFTAKSPDLPTIRYSSLDTSTSETQTLNMFSSTDIGTPNLVKVWRVTIKTVGDSQISAEVTGPFAHWSEVVTSAQTVIAEDAEGLQAALEDSRRGLKIESGDLKLWEGTGWRVSTDAAMGVWGRKRLPGWVELSGGGCTLRVGSGTKVVYGMLDDVKQEEITDGKAVRDVTWTWPAKMTNSTLQVTFNFNNYDLKLLSSNFSQDVLPNEFTKILWKDNSVQGGPFSIECGNSSEICKLPRMFKKLAYFKIKDSNSNSFTEIDLSHNLWFGTHEILVDLNSNQIWSCALIGFESSLCTAPRRILQNKGIQLTIIEFLYDFEITKKQIYITVGIQKDKNAEKRIASIILDRASYNYSAVYFEHKMQSTQPWENKQLSFSIAESSIWEMASLFLLIDDPDTNEPSNLSAISYDFSNPETPTFKPSQLSTKMKIRQFSVTNSNPASKTSCKFVLTLNGQDWNGIVSYTPLDSLPFSEIQYLANPRSDLNFSDYTRSEVAGGIINDFKSKFIQQLKTKDFEYTSLLRDFQNDVYRVPSKKLSNKLLLLPAYSIYKLGVIHPVLEEGQVGIYEKTQDSNLKSTDTGRFYESGGLVFFKPTSGSEKMSYMSLDPTATYLNHTNLSSATQTNIYLEHSLTCRTPIQHQQITTNPVSVSAVPSSFPSSSVHIGTCKNTVSTPSECQSIDIEISGDKQSHVWRLEKGGEAGQWMTTGRFVRQADRGDKIKGAAGDGRGSVWAGWRLGRFVVTLEGDKGMTAVEGRKDERGLGVGTGQVLAVAQVEDGKVEVVARIPLEHGGGDGLFWARVKIEELAQTGVAWKRVGKDVLQSFENGVKIAWSSNGLVVGVRRDAGPTRFLTLYSPPYETQSEPIDFGLEPYDYSILASPDSPIFFVLSARTFSYYALELKPVGSIVTLKSVSPLIEFTSPPSFLQCNILASNNDWDCFTVSSFTLHQIKIRQSDENLVITKPYPKYALHKNFEVTQVEASSHSSSNKSYLLVAGFRNVGNNMGSWRESFSLMYYPQSQNTSNLTYAVGALLSDDLMGLGILAAPKFIASRGAVSIADQNSNLYKFNVSETIGLRFTNTKIDDLINKIKLIVSSDSNRFELKITNDQIKTEVEYVRGEKVKRFLLLVVAAVSTLIVVAVLMVVCTRTSKPKHDGQIYYDGSESLTGQDGTMDHSKLNASSGSKQA